MKVKINKRYYTIKFDTLEDKYQKPLLEWLNNKNKKQESLF